MGRFKATVFRTLFCDFDFFVALSKLGVNLFLTFRTDALCVSHSSPPSVASTINANGRRIIDIVTKRSYVLTFCIVDIKVARRIEE